MTLLCADDQCINGDKTVAHWLFDEDIYTNMSLFQKPTDRTQRYAHPLFPFYVCSADNPSFLPVRYSAMGLHKLMRLLTLSMAGEGYLSKRGVFLQVEPFQEAQSLLDFAYLFRLYGK